MSERDRGKLGSDLVLLIAVGFLVAIWTLFIWGFSAQNAYRTYAGEERAKAYEGYRQSAECAPTRFLLDPCAPGQVSTESDSATAEYDLAAQNKMADWAALMVLTSAAGFVASIVGIYFIRETLLINSRAVMAAEHGNRQSARAAIAAQNAADAATRANDIARENVLLDQRPWLDLAVEDGGGTAVIGDIFSPHVLLTTTNFGKSPAVDVSFHVIHETFGDVLETKDLTMKMAELMNGDDWPHGDANWVAMPNKGPFVRLSEDVPQGKYTVHSRDDGEKRYIANLICGVRYRTVYERHWRFTIRMVAFAFDTSRQDPGSGENIGGGVTIADHFSGHLIT
ncbi:MAG: hypothetical protein ABIY37_04840 [Devosia sp.]